MALQLIRLRFHAACRRLDRERLQSVNLFRLSAWQMEPTRIARLTNLHFTTALPYRL